MQCGSGDIMVLVCHVILNDSMIKGSCNFMGGAPRGKSPPANSGGHRHCGGADMFLVVEGQDSTRLNPPSLLISNAHGMKSHGMPY